MEKVFDFDELMRATTEVNVQLPNGKERAFYQRALTITEKEEVRRIGIRKARDLRKLLRDPKEDVYVREIAVIDDADRDMLVRSMVDARVSEFMAEAVRDVQQIHFPEPGDDPDLDELMDVEDDKDAVDEELDTRRREHVDNRVKEYEKKVEKKEDDELREEYKRIRTERLCYEEFVKWSMHATLYFSTFTDKARKKRWLSSVEEADELGDFFYGKLSDSYNQMDRWSEAQLKN